MPEPLLNAKHTFIDAYNKARESNIRLYSSESNKMYWVGYAGMGSVDAHRLTAKLEKTATELLLESALVPSGKTISTPIDIGEPMYQYQELSEVTLIGELRLKK